MMAGFQEEPRRVIAAETGYGVLPAKEEYLCQADI